jgi:hypothetical protein
VRKRDIEAALNKCHNQHMRMGIYGLPLPEPGQPGRIWSTVVCERQDCLDMAERACRQATGEQGRYRPDPPDVRARVINHAGRGELRPLQERLL